MSNKNKRMTATQPRCLRCPPPCCAPCVSYCIFDLESAIFDTRHIYHRACRELLQSYNRILPEEVLIQCGPMETQEMAELIARKCKLPVPWEQFLVQLNERAWQLISNPPLIEGVERLIRHLHKNCIGLALVTSTPRSLYCEKIRGREDFFNLFTHVLCGDEFNQPRPEPDCYLIAMSMFGEGPCPECVLAFDGTVKGVQAARDARLQVIMMPDPDLPCVFSELATKRLNTYAEFSPEEFGMPFLVQIPPMPPFQRRDTAEFNALQKAALEDPDGLNAVQEEDNGLSVPLADENELANELVGRLSREPSAI